MSRSYSTELHALLAERFIKVGHLVSVELSATLYLSSFGDISWDGQLWVDTALEVSGLSTDGSGVSAGTLTLSDRDGAFGVLALAENFSDARVRIWTVTPDIVEPILEFDGYGDDVSIGAKVRITLAGDSSWSSLSPRRHFNAASGCTVSLPAGTSVHLGSHTLILKR